MKSMRLQKRLQAKRKMPKCHNFSACYMELCKQSNQRPLPVVCVMLPLRLDLTTDRIKLDDWGPILQALSLDRALSSVSIRSRFQSRKPFEGIIAEKRARGGAKIPAVLTRFVLEKLSQSLAQCIRNSRKLSSLELEGIPLPLDCVTVLCMGLSSSQTLQNLSLRSCHIGDRGCEMICQVMTKTLSIRNLNLSQCDLTSNCGNSLSAALTRQKLALYHDAWAQSLRYRQPDFQAMPGLRRLTLNGNPKLGDSVLLKVIEAASDSLWLKALDFQNCGLTNEVLEQVGGLIERNEELLVLDVRKNPSISEPFPEGIKRILSERGQRSKSEFRWLDPPKGKIQGAKSANCLVKAGAKQVNIVRSKSVYVTRSKTRPFVQAPRVAAIPVPPKKTSPKPQQSPKKSPEPVAQVAKLSLHLDIQSQLDPSYETADVAGERKLVEKGMMTETDDESKTLLETMKSENEKLLVQSRDANLLLQKVQAESRALENTVKTLENALKDKERETLREVYKILENLDEEAQNVEEIGPEIGESLDQEGFRRRINSLIRKTKSENLEQGEAQLEGVLTGGKFVKSEGDIHAPLVINPKTPPLFPERRVGDGSEVPESGRRKLLETQRQRARNIFEQLLNQGANDAR